MLEIIFVLYILGLFIFPVPVLAGSAAIGTHYFFYKRYLLFKYQPISGKRIFRLKALTGIGNFFLSLALALLLSFSIHFLVFDFLYLLAFNFIFCFFISLRWFDFLHIFFRKSILKMKPVAFKPGSVFVMYLGFQKGKGFGPGKTPIFLDSGYLTLEENTISFQGVFIHQSYLSKNPVQVEKKSSDQLILTLNQRQHPYSPETLHIIWRDQFYPFKSRKSRDIFFQAFQFLSSMKEKELVIY